MIKTWKHKGLRRFYETGNKAGIIPAHAERLTKILQFLEAAIRPEDMNLPGMKFHGLTGKEKGTYSVMVNGNWRVIFQWINKDAILVDYLDYH